MNKKNMTLKDIEAKDFASITKNKDDLEFLISCIESGELSQSKAMEVVAFGINYVIEKSVEAMNIMHAPESAEDIKISYRKATHSMALAKGYIKTMINLFEKYPVIQNLCDNLFYVVGHHEYSAVIQAALIKEGIENCGEQHTYFMLNPDTGMIKIGKSCNIYTRKQVLQCGAGTKLLVIGIVENDVESELHKRFKDYHYFGEWFDDRDGIIKRYARNTSKRRKPNQA